MNFYMTTENKETNDNEQISKLPKVTSINTEGESLSRSY